MLSILLKSKLHQLRVTGLDPEYEGSLMIDEELLAMAGLREFEKILVANIENGSRFETYAIKGPRGSRVACLNGAAALTGKVGDRLIIMSWCHLRDDEIAAHRPTVVRLGPENRPLKD